MHVLVVEDQKGEPAPVGCRLHFHGHEVVTVGTGVEALETFGHVELVLLDLELPDMDGLEVCRRIRGSSDIPIIAFTSRRAEADRVLGLQAGSDDCLAKPYGFRELLARIDAVMRRYQFKEMASPPPRPELSIGGMRINTASREVRVHGRSIELTRKEFDLLHYLACRPETVVPRQEIMAEIWNDPSSHTLGPQACRTIDTHVSSLRGKLGHSGWIRTVRGVGFRIGSE
jgi:DNA-binding response OmpR family regulator